MLSCTERYNHQKRTRFGFVVFRFSQGRLFRLSVKIRKTPLGVRPILNMGSACLAQISTLLVEKLGPLLKLCPAVLQSSDQLLEDLPSYLHEDDLLATFDVTDLYPSTDQPHLKQVLCPEVRRLSSSQLALADLCKKLLVVILDNMFVEWKARKFWIKT